MGNWYSLKFKQCHMNDLWLFHKTDDAEARDLERFALLLTTNFKNLNKFPFQKKKINNKKFKESHNSKQYNARN